MTEYWVSQGNKWCDFCKIYISNNPSSIRNHELGQRHKDNVAKRLAVMRKENATKEKEQKETARALEQIEAKAQRSYQKDKAKFEETRQSHELDDQEWQFDDNSGKWVTQEEAYASPQFSSNAGISGPNSKFLSTSQSKLVKEKTENKSQNGPSPGPVVSYSLNPKRNVKGTPSSLTVGKRKRPEEKCKAKVIPEEEKAALKAREAARKRVEEREKSLLGLYSKPY
ncbi:zinc finger protein ZOP1 isoform X2 [Arachis duranensis]|uniref:Zinc finger protein ZOP1 isoform X2 n=1 Tax=Arachis duranensis TaxID=130453 RepID=A0A6P5MVV9_ARADU|nr:zinc finger protein ZOP1 isoform X2 [Arachis duranensis]